MAVELTPENCNNRSQTQIEEVGKVPENTGFNGSKRAASKLSPNPRPLPKGVTAEYLGSDELWHEMSDDRPLNGQPGADSGELDAIPAGRNK